MTKINWGEETVKALRSETKNYTLEEVQKKFKDKYVDVYRKLDYSTGEVRFEIRKVYKEIHENTTLGQDVGTELAYRR